MCYFYHIIFTIPVIFIFPKRRYHTAYFFYSIHLCNTCDILILFRKYLVIHMFQGTPVDHLNNLIFFIDMSVGTCVSGNNFLNTWDILIFFIEMSCGTYVLGHTCWTPGMFWSCSEIYMVVHLFQGKTVDHLRHFDFFYRNISWYMCFRAHLLNTWDT